MSDSELYSLCKKYGLQTRMWKRKFAGLLPEVESRNLHRRRGYASITEFALKLAAMSPSSVERVVSLARRLKDKPLLYALLEDGKVGWTKLELVAAIATVENQAHCVKMVKEFSYVAMLGYIKELRAKNEREMWQAIRVEEDGKSFPVRFSENMQSGESYQNEIINGVSQISYVGDLTHVDKNGDIGDTSGVINTWNNYPSFQKWSTISFPVSPEVEKELRICKHELEKEMGITLTFNEVLRILMQRAMAVKKMRRSEKIQDSDEKSEQDKIQDAKVGSEENGVCHVSAEVSQDEKASRYIPAAVRHQIENKYGKGCAFRNCKNAAVILHHIERFAILAAKKNATEKYTKEGMTEGNCYEGKNEGGAVTLHDPTKIIPLCKEHERLVHTSRIRDESLPPSQWEVIGVEEVPGARGDIPRHEGKAQAETSDTDVRKAASLSYAIDKKVMAYRIE